jgi:predicted nucleic acid-binding protein
MKVFADANILVSVVNKEYPLFPYTSRILSLAGTDHFRIYTSPVCLAIAFYFAEKRYKAAIAKERLQVLSMHMEIAGTDTLTVRKAFTDPAVKDLEDGLQYFSALDAGCTCIITENKEDFYFSRIEVLSSTEFFQRHLAPRKKRGSG